MHWIRTSGNVLVNCDKLQTIEFSMNEPDSEWPYELVCIFDEKRNVELLVCKNESEVDAVYASLAEFFDCPCGMWDSSRDGPQDRNDVEKQWVGVDSRGRKKT